MSVLAAGFASLEDGRPMDVVVGRIKKAEPNREAGRPAYRLEIDLGERGVQSAIAPLTRGYTPEELAGRQILCAVEVPPRRRKRLMVTVLASLCPERGFVVLRPTEDRGDGTRLAWD